MFCGEASLNGSIGGLHITARYLELQQKGLAERLPNNVAKEEVIPGVTYTVGVRMKFGNIWHQSPVKGYGYTLNAEDILAIASKAYKNNPNPTDVSRGCNLSVTDDGTTFSTVFVGKLGGVRTFYPDATPNLSNQICKS